MAELCEVARFVGIGGIRVGVMCQDSYFLASAHQDEGVQWDCPEALNHDMIYLALEQAVNDASLDFYL